jgi:hypothetical protein
MPSTIEFDHDEEDEEDGHQTPSKKRNNSRKTTISAGKSTGKSPVSKMTKAEVSAAITIEFRMLTLLEAHSRTTVYSGSPHERSSAFFSGDGL